jgi:hypothetical protein
MRAKLGAVVALVLTCGLATLLIQDSHSIAQTQKDAKSTRLLRHVVLFKFKAGTTPEKIKQIEDAFRALPGKIDSIKDFEWGTDNSPEGKSHGYTHCFFVSFADEKGREKYLPHAAHQEFVSIVKDHVDDVCVVDYWTGK